MNLLSDDKNQEYGKWKRPNEQTHENSSNDKGKGSFKGKKIECFKCGGLGHYANDCPSLKDIKKSMQATWSNIDSEESASTTFEDARYDPNDFLAFIASVEFVYDSDCDNDSDDEFTDDQRVEFLSNLVAEYEKLFKSYLKDHNILEAHKNKITMLNVKKTNLLEKIRFLESEHYSLLENNNALTQEIKSNKPSSFVNENFDPRTKVLNEILDKCKTLGHKEVWGTSTKMKLPLVEKLCLSKVKMSL